MKEDRFSPKRMIRMLGILISVAIYSVFLAIICKFTIDRVGIVHHIYNYILQAQQSTET